MPINNEVFDSTFTGYTNAVFHGEVDDARAECFDTADTVAPGEISLEELDFTELEGPDLQWYAGELRRCCGDDVACEELSAIATDVYLYIS